MTEQAFETAYAEIQQLFEETEQRLEEYIQETDRRMQEIDGRMQETDRRLLETERRLQETNERLDRLSREADRRFRRLEELSAGPGGKLVEALFRPDALTHFQERGINVSKILRGAESRHNGDRIEIDLLLINEGVVAIEAKTTLKLDDVREFLSQLNQFEDFFPEYQGKRIYGAVSGLKIEEESDQFAYRQGLFVLGMVGDDMTRILNDPAFKPKDFSRTN